MQEKKMATTMMILMIFKKLVTHFCLLNDSMYHECNSVFDKKMTNEVQNATSQIQCEYKPEKCVIYGIAKESANP